MLGWKCIVHPAWQDMSPRNSALLLLLGDLNARMKKYHIIYLAIIAPRNSVLLLLLGDLDDRMKRYRKCFFVTYCTNIMHKARLLKGLMKYYDVPLLCLKYPTIPFILYLPILLSPWLIPAATWARLWRWWSRCCDCCCRCCWLHHGHRWCPLRRPPCLRCCHPSDCIENMINIYVTYSGQYHSVWLHIQCNHPFSSWKCPGM